MDTMDDPKESEHVTRTFRIAIDYDEALREEAEKKGTSVNSLANQIMKKFCESGRYFSQGQSITLAPRTFGQIIEYLSNEDIADAGKKSGQSIPKDRLLMRGMILDRKSIIWFITEVLSSYNDWFTCDIHERKDYTLFHLRHVYEEKWSIFIMNYIASMVEDLLGITDLHFSITSSTVSFQLPK